MEAEWYEDGNKVARLAAHLAHYNPEDAETVAHMVGKPWLYQEEYEEMEAEQLAAANAIKIEAEA